METSEITEPILIPITESQNELVPTKKKNTSESSEDYSSSYTLSKSNKRERSPTLANLSSTPKYNKDEDSEAERKVEEIINFDGYYNKYIKFIFESDVEVYRIKKWNSYQFVVESIKYSLGIKSPRCFCLEVGKSKYLGYKVHRDSEDNKIWEETPFGDFPTEYWTDKFVSSYKTIIFFRYLMGLKTTCKSLKVAFDGYEYYPISVAETIQSKSDNRSGKDFIISSIKIKSGEKDAFKDKYIIDPNTELRKLCRSKNLKITRKEITEFLDKLRSVIRNADSSYIWLVNSINLRISSILDV